MKSAIVIGGMRRVGAEIARSLAMVGYEVIVSYSSQYESGLMNDLEELNPAGNHMAVRVDVGFGPDIDKLRGVNNLQTIVNCADRFLPSPFPVHLDTWDRVMAVTLRGAMEVANTLGPALVPGGVLIHIADTSAVHPQRGYIAHSVAKAGLVALTKSLALEWAPTRRCCCVIPGLVLPPDGVSPSWIERKALENPLKRWGSPLDIADAVVFLAQSSFSTGSIITTDGGETI